MGGNTPRPGDPDDHDHNGKDQEYADGAEAVDEPRARRDPDDAVGEAVDEPRRNS
ncbi:MAG TPA: hypothetical protein VEK80_07710 [Kribbellaceae bacterium]|nr:hypothetical protein [Kribbellaceae bacterium]